MKNIYLDFKFSLFADFKNIRQDIQDFSIKVGSSFSRRIENQVVGTFVIPVYVFENEQATIAIMNDRIDYIAKRGDRSSFSTFVDFLERTKNFYVSFSRLAINSTYFIDSLDVSKFLSLLPKKTFTNHFIGTKEYYERENYLSEKNGLIFNNIISFGTHEIINRETFVKMNTILFSIDINNVPLDNQTNSIRYDGVVELFEYMLSNYDHLIEGVTSLVLGEKADAID